VARTGWIQARVKVVRIFVCVGYPKCQIRSDFRRGLTDVVYEDREGRF
jgi:hypothetical protein